MESDGQSQWREEFQHKEYHGLQKKTISRLDLSYFWIIIIKSKFRI